MDNQCPLCEDQYSSQNPPRLLIGCGHSYCEKCFSKMITENKGEYVIICPEDGEMVTLKNNNVSNIPKNIALLKIIESKKNNSSFKDPELQMSKIVKTQQIPHDDDQARDLVDAITSSNSMSLGSEQKINFQKQQTTKGQIQTEKEEQKQVQKPKEKIQQTPKEVMKQKPKQKSKEKQTQKIKQKVVQKSQQKTKPKQKQKEKEKDKEKEKAKQKVKEKNIQKEIQNPKSKSKSKPKQKQNQKQKLKESPKSKPKEKASDKKKEEQVQKVKQKAKQKSKSKPKQKAKQKSKQTPKQNKQKNSQKKKEEQVQKIKQKPKQKQKQKSKSKPKEKPVQKKVQKPVQKVVQKVVQKPAQKPVEKPIEKPKEVKIIQMCKTHQKPLQVVCILDLKKICVNCAIFGDHKGHQFKSLQQIQSQRMAYYSAILQIMQKKETINSRISNEQTCHSIMQILENKKTKMKSTIVEKFKKLMDSILFKQKQSLKSLDGLIQKTETKLKNLMKIDPQVLHKYDSWEEKSFDQIKILQGNNFQAKLQLIFADTETIDVLQAGDIIIDQMNRQQENLINQVQVALDNIGTEFNMEIFNHIDSFVEIFDEPKKKKMKPRISKTESQSVLPGLYSTAQNNRIFGSNKKQDSIVSAKEETSMFKNPNNSVLIVKSQNSQEKKPINILNHEQDLLDIQFESSTIKRPQFVKTEQIQVQPEKIVQSPLRVQKNVVSPTNQSFLKTTGTISNQLSPRTKTSVNQSMFLEKTIDKPTKKKVMTKLKLPDKYDKIIEGILNDQLDTADFTNAQLGDSTIISISQLIYGTKTKNVKFIRNKLSDEGVNKLIPYMKGVITLNLSQNQLTQKVLDIIIQKRQSLQCIKSIILSQNKITQRKAKQKVDKLKQLDIVISL